MMEFVFLDLDDTILDFAWAEGKAIRRTLTTFGVEPTEEICALYSRINLEHWRRLERKEITRQELQVSRFRQLQQKIGLEADAEIFADTYVKHLSQGHSFLPGALQTLCILEKQYRLFLVTNGTAAVQYGRLKSADISRYFEKIFISEELGANKPHKEFFDRCFAAIPGFDRSKAIIVGDSLSSDIRGGINAGITTCWVNPHHREIPDDIHPDYQIESLPDLLPILENL